MRKIHTWLRLGWRKLFMGSEHSPNSQLILFLYSTFEGHGTEKRWNFGWRSIYEILNNDYRCSKFRSPRILYRTGRRKSLLYLYTARLHRNCWSLVIYIRQYLQWQYHWSSKHSSLWQLTTVYNFSAYIFFFFARVETNQALRWAFHNTLCQFKMFLGFFLLVNKRTCKSTT